MSEIPSGQLLALVLSRPSCFELSLLLELHWHSVIGLDNRIGEQPHTALRVLVKDRSLVFVRGYFLIFQISPVLHICALFPGEDVS